MTGLNYAHFSLLCLQRTSCYRNKRVTKMLVLHTFKHFQPAFIKVAQWHPSPGLPPPAGGWQKAPLCSEPAGITAASCRWRLVEEIKLLLAVCKQHKANDTLNYALDTPTRDACRRASAKERNKRWITRNALMATEADVFKFKTVHCWLTH